MNPDTINEQMEAEMEGAVREVLTAIKHNANMSKFSSITAAEASEYAQAAKESTIAFSCMMSNAQDDGD